MNKKLYIKVKKVGFLALAPGGRRGRSGARWGYWANRILCYSGSLRGDTPPRAGIPKYSTPHTPHPKKNQFFSKNNAYWVVRGCVGVWCVVVRSPRRPPGASAKNPTCVDFSHI